MGTTLDISELDATIGRLFMAGIPGTVLDKGTEQLIRDHCLGGVILFSHNVEDPVQVATLCNELQHASLVHHGIPLFLAVDQEGGRVSRLQSPFRVFPGNASIGRDEHPEKRAREFAQVTAQEMALVGLNMDLAPVVDVRRGEPESHLAGRMFSDRPREVARLGSMVVKVLQEGGVMAVAKHFPGLGKASLDPHHRLPTIHADGKEIQEIHLPPFEAAIAAGVTGVMTSHAIYPALDADRPATLSSAVLTDLLRGRLGYEGLVITDDLEMGAIVKKWSVEEGAAAAFAAGADVLLICHDQANVRAAMGRVRQKLLSNEIPMARLHQSVRRVTDAKARFLGQVERVSLESVRAHFGMSPVHG